MRKPRSLKHRSGMALMLVIPAVAVASVLAYAVLANTGTQDQISENAIVLAQTDCLAESGINYAMFNLQNPLLAPTFIGTYWPGTGGTAISLAGSSGTVMIGVADFGAGEYLVTSTATAAAPSTTTRTMKAMVQLTVPAVAPNQAAGFSGVLNLGLATILNIVGNVTSNAAVTLNSLSSVLGNLTQNVSTATVPTSTTNLSSYVMNGITYSAKLLSTAPVAGTVLGPTATNPAGVYRYTGSTLNLNGVTINGTLYAPNTVVDVTGSSANTITAAADFPALIAQKITVVGSNKQLTANGIVWSNAGISSSGTTTGSTITVNGSMLIPSTPAISTAYAGTINLNYVSKYVNVPNFSSTAQTPTNIKVVGWNQ